MYAAGQYLVWSADSIAIYVLSAQTKFSRFVSFPFLLHFFSFLAHPTAGLRTEMVLQEKRIAELSARASEYAAMNAECGAARRRQRRLLRQVVRAARGDNVPLSARRCHAMCAGAGVRAADCRDLCASDPNRLADPEDPARRPGDRRPPPPCAYLRSSDLLTPSSTTTTTPSPMEHSALTPFPFSPFTDVSAAHDGGGESLATSTLSSFVQDGSTSISSTASSSPVITRTARSTTTTLTSSSERDSDKSQEDSDISTTIPSSVILDFAKKDADRNSSLHDEILDKNDTKLEDFIEEDILEDVEGSRFKRSPRHYYSQAHQDHEGEDDRVPLAERRPQQRVSAYLNVPVYQTLMTGRMTGRGYAGGMPSEEEQEGDLMPGIQLPLFLLRLSETDSTMFFFLWNLLF